MQENQVRIGFLQLQKVMKQFGRQAMLDHMAHLIKDQIHRSSSRPMGDSRDVGPMWIGPVDHHPSGPKPEDERPFL